MTYLLFLAAVENTTMVDVDKTSMLYCSQAGLFSRFMARVLPYMGIPKGTSQGNGTWLPLCKLESHSRHVLPEELLMLPSYRTG